MDVPFSPPLISEDEINEVVDTLRSGWITTGPKTKKFEQMITNYCGTDRTVCLSSATAALELTLRVLGIEEGDEVITTAYTYTATAAAICHTGAKLVLVDCKSDDFLIDYDAVANKINKNTKAIIPVDIAGIPCDYHRINEIVNCKRHLFKANNQLQKSFGRVVVITDAAHSLGAEILGIKSCYYADFTAFSFHAVKNLTTAEGGAVTWKKNDCINSDEIYRLYQLYSLHGQSKDALSKTKKGNWEYDVVAPLYKYNMTDILASIGVCQLKKYNEYLDIRHKIIKQYNNAFKHLPVVLPQHKSKEFNSSAHLYLLRFKKDNIDYRNKFIYEMAKKGVSCNVHYKPLPLLTAYKDLGFLINNFTVAYNCYINEISLPVFNSMSDEQVAYVIKSFNEVLEVL